MDPMTEEEAARRAGTTPETLRAWIRDGLIPRFDGAWTPEVAAQARLVGRLRARGHTAAQIREAEERGALAFGGIEHLLGASGREIPLCEAGGHSPHTLKSPRRSLNGLSWNSASTRRRASFSNLPRSFSV